ncbi:hypothetical protein GNZ12_29390 [Paraburkholderia sp. 1N]|uniref:Uncharacterized protein n=1 Tax=Paraburkholderia solitsugae TaxID=2675748 RepID=A0ABX2BZ87_9BURK|nr:hypothetical protein [Paraburkholderia solitsugae]NPT45361.1 hypothetical protein [Paraburkholderia solitsugae]
MASDSSKGPISGAGSACAKASLAEVWKFSCLDDTTQVAVSGRMKSNSTEVLREAVLDDAGIAPRATDDCTVAVFCATR